MKKTTLRLKVMIWQPAPFCALLSIMKMFTPGDAGAPAFYGYLPVCFCFAGFVHLDLLKRIETLEAALADASAHRARVADA